MKRALAILLTFALFLTLTPIYGVSNQANAAGFYFLFPNENNTRESARIVSTQNIQLTGTINGVVGSSISYNIQQVTAAGTEETLNSTEEITTGIQTNTGDNNLTVSSIILFPGMNKITFRGVAGMSTVTESIYIEYRDSPMLYDLKVQFENQEFDVLEDQPTMLYSTATNVQNTGTVVITGRAPNASKVNVSINGRSFDFNVLSTASGQFRFSTSQLTIDKGINNIVFKVHNNGQIVETSRQVAYYNGEVTYYDLKLNHPGSGKSAPLQQNAELSIPNLQGITVTGKAIIPLPLQRAGTPITIIDSTDKAAVLQELEDRMSLQLGNLSATPIVPDSASLTFVPDPILSTTRFITVSFTYQLPQADLSFDDRQSVLLNAPNFTNNNASAWIGFTFRDSGKPYIYDVNYLTGFDSTMTDSTGTTNTKVSKSRNDSRILSLVGTEIPAAGVDVFSVPMGVEILIANPGQITGGTLDDLINLTITGGGTASYRVVESAGSSNVLTQDEQRVINGETVTLRRVFVEILRLPNSGTNTLNFTLGTGTNASAPYTFVARLLYGPYVKFASIVDGRDVKFDSTMGQTDVLLRQLGLFRGQLFNITNPDDIVYKTETDSNGNVTARQSVFLYINNVEIPLAQSSETGSSITSFEPEGVAVASTPTSPNPTITLLNNVLIKAGTNTVKFVFRSANNNYESTLRFNIVPSNLPIIPAPDTDGVYPYTAGMWPPVAADAKFTGQNGVYTTREAEFNVFGTFDFIDLGTDLNSLEANYQAIEGKKNYMVTISNPDWQTDVKWDLSKQLTVVGSNRQAVNNASGVPMVLESNRQDEGGNANTPDAGMTFYYDHLKQSFMFRMEGQKMPEDGSTMVYVITVFNAGESGPRATYRLEVRPISIPYTIKSPVEEERVTNKNFVEVIITSPGADSITVGKEVAEKIIYRDHNGSTTEEGTPVEAFRVVFKNLRAGRDTKIPFTITRGTDTIKQDLTVKYVPTNIPGAQMMTTMGTNHKMFNNTLTLTFTKGTQLIRPRYNDQIDYAYQVYNEHDILFAIANPNDGIVDRHMYESQPPNYSAESQASGNLNVGFRFQDQARQFIKASPLYWIDAGFADDPATTSYDPIGSGLDPFPFPNRDGVNWREWSVSNRLNLKNRELIPSSSGKLTLTYDSSVVQSAGTTITVFRFDPYNSTWENIGGVVDDKKKTVTVPFNKFGYYVAVKLTRGFNDITDHPYAREAMEAMFSKGIMNAIDPIGVFGGDRFVTRGEFTRMIVRALDLPLNYEGELHFSYYPETMTNANNSSAIYDYRYIETAARAGIVNGKRPGFFDEDVELSRQEAATILARALQIKQETDSAKAKTQLDKIFKDSGTFDFYAIPPVLAIQKKGFIQGKLVNPADPKEGSVFEPRARLLRSDAAIIMARVMNDMKKLPKIYN